MSTLKCQTCQSTHLSKDKDSLYCMDCGHIGEIPEPPNDDCVLCGSESETTDEWGDDQYACSNTSCVLQANWYTEEEWAKLGGKS